MGVLASICVVFVDLRRPASMYVCMRDLAISVNLRYFVAMPLKLNKFALIRADLWQLLRFAWTFVDSCAFALISFVSGRFARICVDLFVCENLC